MRIAIVGIRETSLFYGAKLSAAGFDVVLADLWRDAVEGIKREGVRLEEGGTAQVRFIPCCLLQELSGPFDLFLLFHKPAYGEHVWSKLEPLLGKETWLISFQDGLGHEAGFRRHVFPEQSMIGLSTFQVDWPKLGHVKGALSGETLLMPLSWERLSALQELKTLFDQAGLTAEIREDIVPLVWEKLASDIALNSLAVVSRVTAGKVGTIPEGRQLAFQIVTEVLDVAERRGITVDRERVKKGMAEAFVKFYRYKPVMLVDLEQGRKTDVEYMHGAVLREGAECGVVLPSLEVFYKLIKMMERLTES